MTPAELLARHKHVLLDFDGPVCAVFGGEASDRAVADDLKRLAGPNLPDDVAAAHDPFDMLRYASKLGASTAQAVEARFRELEAVATAPATPGARTTIETHDLSRLIGHVSARETADARLLKPDPFLVYQAIDALGTAPSACVMIGNSDTDVDAARTARAAVIGYANKPGKRERLQRRGADAVIDELSELPMSIHR